jgi:dephospho-CoA kinase
MLRVGLTGNVASGKTTVARLFRAWGATVIEADELAREAVAPGTRTLAAVARRFGEDLLLPGGGLDRATLRRRVMGDAGSRAALEAIVHPEVQRLRTLREAQAAADGARIVVHDIPLLFEALDPAFFDVVVLVDAPEHVRRERLLGLRSLSESEADALLKAQHPPGPKRARSTYVIDNGGTLKALEASARAVWDELLSRAERA